MISLSGRFNFDLFDELFLEFRRRYFWDGTSTATGAFVKRTLMLLAALALLAAAAGCSKSNSTGESSAANSNAAQSAEESASHAWQDTKGAATNAWNATKVEATNVWNKTTNAVHR